MKKHSFIKNIVAFILLFVFTISITPKKYFHDAFFEHHDELFAPVTGEAQLSSYQFSCGFVNVVALTPFVPAFIVSNSKLFTFPAINRLAHSQLWGRLNIPHFSLRGPPVA